MCCKNRISALPSPEARLFNLTLSEYEQAFRWGLSSLKLDDLKMSPHSARHGGASEDAYNNVRTIEAVKERGRWQALASVARYRKAGSYLRTVASLPTSIKKMSAARKQIIHNKIVAAAATMTARSARRR